MADKDLLTPEIDIAERGRSERRDSRLFLQLTVFTGCLDTRPLIEALASAGLTSVLYEQLHDAQGVGLLTLTASPEDFFDKARPFLHDSPFAKLQRVEKFDMFGRTYAMGYEASLDETLFHRPTRHALNPQWPWAVWYPLRRSPAFEQLTAEEQRDILMEHGRIGMAFGQAGLAHDIRLACHGLDPNDNDFVIGLVGDRLHPLSAIVQRMRKTIQTSRYLQHLGPFFVGRSVWRSPLAEPTPHAGPKRSEGSAPPATST